MLISIEKSGMVNDTQMIIFAAKFLNYGANC